MSRHTGISVTPESRDEFRHLVYELIGRSGRRVDMSEALIAISTVAKRHVEEVIEELGK